MYKRFSAFTPFLYVPGILYRAGLNLHNRAFETGFMPVYTLPQPTISVGNLTLGGTGKTPFVIYLAVLLKEMGAITAVLTRGYGRIQARKTIILSPDDNSHFSAQQIGDEPSLLRRRLPETWFGISANRFSTANSISQQKNPEKKDGRFIFVLDDGFQHRKIHRDLDIVLIDQNQPPYSERLFPLGSLREPVAQLRRANVVVINGIVSPDATKTKNDSVSVIKEKLRIYAPDAEFFHCFQPIQDIIPYYTWIDAQKQSPSISDIKTAFLAAAIGNPYRFKQDIKGMGIEIRGCAFFRDHAAIDWKNCIKSAQKEGAEAIIITEKDAVKISRPPDFPLFVAIQTTVIPEAERFCQILQKRIFPDDSVAHV